MVDTPGRCRICAAPVSSSTSTTCGPLHSSIIRSFATLQAYERRRATRRGLSVPDFARPAVLTR